MALLSEDYGMPRISLVEAARAADVSYITVLRYHAAGVISGIRGPGNRWLVEPSAVKTIREHYRKQGAPGGRPRRDDSDRALEDFYTLGA